MVKLIKTNIKMFYILSSTVLQIIYTVFVCTTTTTNSNNKQTIVPLSYHIETDRLSPLSVYGRSDQTHKLPIGQLSGCHFMSQLLSHFDENID